MYSFNQGPQVAHPLYLNGTHFIQVTSCRRDFSLSFGIESSLIMTTSPLTFLFKRELCCVTRSKRSFKTSKPVWILFVMFLHNVDFLKSERTCNINKIDMVLPSHVGRIIYFPQVFLNRDSHNI